MRKKTKFTFWAKGSTKGRYKVVFAFEKEDTILIFCNCKAGQNYLLCKHVIDIASSDISRLYEKKQIDELTKLQEELKEKNLWYLFSQLKDAQLTMENIEQEIKGYKKQIKQNVLLGPF